MSLALQNAKKLLYAVWAPNGHDLLVTTSSNVNSIIDVRKEAVIKALPNDIEVCLQMSTPIFFLSVIIYFSAARFSDPPPS